MNSHTNNNTKNTINQEESQFHFHTRFKFDNVYDLPEDEFVVNIFKIVDMMDLNFLEPLFKQTFTNQGRPKVPLKLILKVLLFGKSKGYSLRKTAKALKNDDEFKFLLNGSKHCPRLMTLSKYMRIFDDHIDAIIAAFNVAQERFLTQKKLAMSNEVCYVDGTILEASNNSKKVKTKKKVMKLIEKLTTAIATKEPNEQQRQVLEEELAKNLTFLLYIGERDSTGITDFDSISIKSKKGNMIAGYNVQLATEGNLGLAVGWKVYNKPQDNSVFIEFYEYLSKNIKKFLKVCADAGYGIQEIYKYLKDLFVTPIIKPMLYESSKTKITAKDFNVSEDLKTATCPNGKVLKYEKIKHKKSTTGYSYIYNIYKNDDCSGCPLSDNCLAKDQENRVVHININARKHANEAIQILESEEGKETYGLRSHFCEAPFGYLKSNGFKLRRRGLAKANLDFTLAMFVFNITKITNKLDEKKQAENERQKLRRKAKREERKKKREILRCFGIC